MNNKKILIKNQQMLISICDENIKEEKDRIKVYRRVIENIYNSCEHDFESVACCGASMAECKICGYADGV